MKKIRSAFISVFFLLFLFSCNDDENENNSSSTESEVYYSLINGGEKELLSSNDTLKIYLGDTIYISMCSSNSTNLLYENNNTFNIESSGDSTFTCANIASGSTDLIAIAIPEYNDDAITSKFHVNIDSYKYDCMNFEGYKEPSYTVDVDDNELGDKILEYLEDSTLLNKIESMTLICDGIYGGTLTGTTKEHESITGTFSTDFALNMSNLTLTINNSVYSFTLEQDLPAEYLYDITQDLTSTFKTKYPSSVINKVNMTCVYYLNGISIVN